MRFDSVETLQVGYVKYYLPDAPRDVTQMIERAREELKFRFGYNFNPCVPEKQWVITVLANDELAGLILWTNFVVGWWIDIAYIAPEMRRCGLYTGLRDEFDVIAKADGKVLHIDRLVHPDNTATIAMLASRGVHPTNYLYREVVADLKGAKHG